MKIWRKRLVEVEEENIFFDGRGEVGGSKRLREGVYSRF